MTPGLHEILAINAIAFVIILCTGLFNRTLLNQNVAGLHYWRMMVPLTGMAIICETVTFILSGNMAYWAYWLLVITNSYCYVMNFLMPVIWLKFISVHLYRAEASRYSMRAMNAYIIITFAAVAINIFYPIFFRFNAYHIYERVLPGFIIAAVIPVILLVISIADYFKYTRKKHGMKFFHVEAFLAPVFIGYGVQMFSSETSFIWISVSIGMSCVAFALQNEARNRDVLTGLFNRAYLEFLSATRLVKESEHFGGIMLDINGFKKINDEQGHRAGDIALIETAEVLEHTVGTEGIIIRYAGDEFIVLMPNYNKEAMDETIERINAAFDDYNKSQDRFQISLSIGFSSFDPKTETVDVFLNRIDADMYKNKRAFYEVADKDRRGACQRAEVM